MLPDSPPALYIIYVVCAFNWQKVTVTEYYASSFSFMSNRAKQYIDVKTFYASRKSETNWREMLPLTMVWNEYQVCLSIFPWIEDTLEGLQAHCNCEKKIDNYN